MSRVKRAWYYGELLKLRKDYEVRKGAGWPATIGFRAGTWRQQLGSPAAAQGRTRGKNSGSSLRAIYKWKKAKQKIAALRNRVGVTEILKYILWVWAKEP